MKVLKRNQLIILIISLMLITAGYLNFTTNNEIMTSTIGERSDYTIGDAELVSTIPKEEENSEELFQKEENTTVNIVDTANNNENNLLQSEVETVTPKEDYYFTNSKMERNNMYSEDLDIYQQIYNNVNSTSEQKNEAISKINKINNTKNAIMIAENLVIAKGFKDIVIFVNEDSVSVVVKAEELMPEQVAQIQNIVSRELNVSAEKIHISNKNV